MPKQLPAEDNPKYAATHLEGFMEKQSHDNAKKFQRRWFCLVNQWLAYAQVSVRGWAGEASSLLLSVSNVLLCCTVFCYRSVAGARKLN